MRKPYPIWGVFNPIKVLPEVLEPFGGYIAAFLVYPFLGDYVRSISIVQSCIVSLFILAFCVSFTCFLVRRMKMTRFQAIVAELLFLLSFFIVYKHYGGESYYGFWASDLNSYFNYIIPGLLNASIVLWMAQMPDFMESYLRLSSYKKGMFILGVYFAIFSSIQLSIILAGYCSWIIIKKGIGQILETHKFSFAWIVKEMWLYFVIEILWFISLLFESQGRRAGMLNSDTFFPDKAIVQTLNQLMQLAKQVNRFFLVTMMLVFLVTLFVLCREKNRDIQCQCIGHLYLICLTTLYLVLLYAKTGGAYAVRPDATWAILFYVLLLFQVCIAILMARFQSVRCLMPLILVMVSLTAANQNYRYMYGGRDYETCKAIDEYIIGQIVAADEAGLDIVEVKVPKENNETNWPHPYNMAGWLQNTLYSHHIIKTRIKIVFVPDDSVNDMFYTYDRTKMEPFIDFEVR